MPRSDPGSDSSVIETDGAAAAGSAVISRFPPMQLERTRSCKRQDGFTLIELMIVVVLIAVASSLASLALRDPASTMLEREGARLAALLEGARGEARASGLVAYWEPRTASPEVPGFRFVGLPPTDDRPSNWLETGVTAEVVGARAVVLGPEPLIGAQRIVLRLRDQRLTLATDGLGPFAVAPEADATRP